MVATPDLDLDFTTGTLPSGVALSRTGIPMCATYFTSVGMLEYAQVNWTNWSQAISNWGKTDTTVVDNSAVAPDGTTTASLCTEGSAGTAQLVNGPTSGLNAGQTITYSVYLKRGNTDWIELILTDTTATNGATTWFNTNTGAWGTRNTRGTATIGASGVLALSNGWYRLWLTCFMPASSTSTEWVVRTATADTSTVRVSGGTYYMWGAQSELGASPTTYIPTLTSSTNGAPRYDYDPITHALNGLLIEETRSNLWIQSGDLSTTSNNASPADFAAKVQNAAVAPDGTLTACNLIPSTGTGVHLAYRSFTGATSTTYTWSVFLKQNGYAFAQLALGNTGFPANINANFNLSTGTVVSTGVGAVGSGIQNVGNGWYRCWVIGTSQSSAGTYVANVTPYNGGSTSFAGDGVSGLLAWGGQVEAGVFQTSYIPTGAASVQRLQDIATVASGAWLTSATNISLAADFNVAYRATVASGVAPVVVELDDGTTNNLVQLRLTAGATPGIQTISFSGGTNLNSTQTTNTWSQNVPAKCAGGFNSSGSSAVLNGSAVVSIVPTGFPTGLNRLAIGSGRTTPVSAWITRVRYWGQVLSNADLITVTSIAPAITGVGGTGTANIIGYVTPTATGVPLAQAVGRGGVGSLSSWEVPGTFTRSSTATYVDANGFVVTVPNNYLRPLYSGSTLIGALLESSATNLALQSASTTGWAGGTNLIVTNNAATAPDNTNSANSLIANTSNAQHEIGPAAVTVTANTTYTCSVYAKANGYTGMMMYLTNNAFNSGIQATFNVSNGTVRVAPVSVGTGVVGGATITALANGWYRCTVTGIIDSSSTSLKQAIYVDNGATNFFTGNGTSGIYVWGAQIELGSSATSYIATTSGTVTRAADSPNSITGITATGAVTAPTEAITSNVPISGIAATATVTALTGGTFSRASSATYVDAAGVLQTAVTNALRIDYSTGSARVLTEASSTNGIRNPRAEGAAVSGNVWPTNWAQVLNPGVTAATVGSGYDSNGIPYWDFHLVGTPTSTQVERVLFEASTQIVAAPNQVWTGSLYTAYVAGSLTNIGNTFILLLMRNSSGSNIGQLNSTATPLATSLVSQRRTVTMSMFSASAAFVSLVFDVSCTIGQAVDVTIRLGAPQLELGSSATSVILPPIGSPATTTRAADIVTPTGFGLVGIAATGVNATGQVTAPTTETDDGQILTGISATTAVGTPSVKIDSTTAITGIAAQAQVGTLTTVTFKTVNLGSVAATTAVGSNKSQIAATAIGNAISALAGIIGINEVIAMIGASVAANTNTVTTKIGALRSTAASTVDADYRIVVIQPDRRRK